MPFDGKAKPVKGRMNTTPKDLERCPSNHPVWQKYYKRIKGTSDTIICCRACDGLPGSEQA